MQVNDIDRRIPGLFAVLGLLLGTLYALVIPPMQVPDEMMHFARVFSVSKGVCIASPDIDIPESFAMLHGLFQPWLQDYHKITTDDIRQALAIPLNENEMAGNGRQRAFEQFINQNLSHCAPYVPAAIALNLGRHAEFPSLYLMYLCRMTNLVCYVALTFLALRLLPDFRIFLFCLALMPMTLQQAASVSSDSPVIAVSFVFAAYVFRLAFAPGGKKLGIREYLVLAALIAFLVLGKSLYCMPFLVLLIPGERFPSPLSRWLAVASCFAVAVVCAAVWQHVNAANIQRMAEERLTTGIDMAANVQFMRDHPIWISYIFARCMLRIGYLSSCLHGFVGNLGWLLVQLPRWLVVTYSALLLAALTTQTRFVRFTVLMRCVLAVYIAAAVFNTLSVGWIGNIAKVAYDRPEFLKFILIPFQGRYWIPVAFPMFVFVSTGKTRFDPRYFAGIAIGVVILASVVALYMVKNSFFRS